METLLAPSSPAKVKAIIWEYLEGENVACKKPFWPREKESTLQSASITITLIIIINFTVD